MENIGNTGLSAEEQGDTVSRNNKLPVKCIKLNIAIPLSGDAAGAIVLSASLALRDSSCWHDLPVCAMQTLYERPKSSKLAKAPGSWRGLVKLLVAGIRGWDKITHT